MFLNSKFVTYFWYRFCVYYAAVLKISIEVKLHIIFYQHNKYHHTYQQLYSPLLNISLSFKGFWCKLCTLAQVVTVTIFTELIISRIIIKINRLFVNKNKIGRPPTPITCSTGDGNRYPGRSFWNHSCFLTSSIEALFIGSTCNIIQSRLTTFLFKYSGIGNIPDLIFLNKVGTCSSSNGSVPQSRAYSITPQDHTSTSGPAYSFPDIT